MRAIASYVLFLYACSANGVSTSSSDLPQVPENYYVEMQHQIENGSSESAIRSLQDRIKENPDDLRLRNLLGVAYTSANRLQEADAQFTAILSSNAQFVPALRNLAINEESLGHHKESIQHFKRVLTLRPKDHVASAYVGSDYFVQRDYSRAFELLSAARQLANSPNINMELAVSKVVTTADSAIGEETETIHSLNLKEVAPGLVVLGGAALAEKGDYNDAVRFFRALPSDLQTNADVTYDLALCLLRSHQGEEASKVLRDYLAFRPHTGSILSLAAEVYASTDQVQKAIDSLREATALEPEVEDHYIDLAELCTQYEAYDVGIEVLTVGLHWLPQSERLYFERGVLEAMKNDFETADRDLAKAQQLSPESNAALAMGVELMQQGKLAEAIQNLRTKAAHDPNNAVVQYMLAEAILQNGANPNSPEMEEVRKALNQSTKGDQTYEPPLVALAKLESQDREFDQAHDLLSKAVVLAPKDSSAWSQLAIVDHRLGLKEEAEDAVRRLSEINQKQRDDRHRLQISTGSPH